MPRIIITAKVEDAEKWEKGFRSHGDLFRKFTQRVAYFCATEENEIAIYEEVDDLETYFAVLKSPETAKALAADGVKPETVKVYVLDKEFLT